MTKETKIALLLAEALVRCREVGEDADRSGGRDPGRSLTQLGACIGGHPITPNWSV